MDEFDSLSTAIENLPGPIPNESPIETVHAPPGAPLVWVAEIVAQTNAHGKGCCRSIQGFNEPGFIQWYAWKSAFDNSRGDSEVPMPEPVYSDAEVAPADQTEPINGGSQIPCMGRSPEGTWSNAGDGGGMYWPTRYIMEAGSPDSEHNWGGWWAFNTCEVCGMSKFLDRNTVSHRHLLRFNWDMVLMGVGIYMGDVYKNCIAEPRPRQIKPFFHRYLLRHHLQCG